MTDPDPSPAGAEPIVSAITPDWVVHPGAFLAELMDERGVDPDRMADALGWNRAGLNAIVAGVVELDEDMAAALARVTQVPARFWLNAERLFREGLAEGKVWDPEPAVPSLTPVITKTVLGVGKGATGWWIVVDNTLSNGQEQRRMFGREPREGEDPAKSYPFPTEAAAMSVAEASRGLFRARLHAEGVRSIEGGNRASRRAKRGPVVDLDTLARQQRRGLN